MKLTSITPTLPGLYIARRPGEVLTICRLTAHRGTDMLSVSFIGEERERSTALLEKQLPGIEYSSGPLDLSNLDGLISEVKIDDKISSDKDDDTEDYDADAADAERANDTDTFELD